MNDLCQFDEELKEYIMILVFNGYNEYSYHEYYLSKSWIGLGRNFGQ